MANDTLQPLLGASPSDQHDMRSMLAFVLRQFELRSDQMLPARVIQYDRAKNVATVQPLIMWIDRFDRNISRNSVVNVPVLSLGAGGFHISFPINEGDLGWVYAADRDLSQFKQTLAESAPNTGRAHRFEDSMFVPDVFRKYTIAGEDSAAMVIQSTDSATRISIRNDNIKITAPSNVTVDTPLAKFLHDVEIDGNLSVQQNTTVTGATSVNGGFSAAGGHPCTLPHETTVAGKQVDGHEHGGVQSGGSNTNPF